MTTRTNTTLDDIAGEIGFTATVTLATWYGGKNIYIPESPDEETQLSKVIGLPAVRRLSANWGGCNVAVPTMWVYEEGQRNRLIGNLLGRGLGTKEIAADMGMTERRIQQIRRALEDAGLLPLLLRGREIMGENAT